MERMSNASLKEYNTFGLDVLAREVVVVKQVEDLNFLRDEGIFERPHLIIGGGSNILLTQDFDGVVLLNQMKGIEILEKESDSCRVRFEGGEEWHACVLWCIENGLGGVENLSLIPGTIGAAPMQNIGAYGVEVKDVFVQLEAFNKNTGQLEVFDKNNCAFGYRESVFKNVLKDQYIITSVELCLSLRNHSINTSYGAIQNVLSERNISNPTIKNVSEAVIAIRSSKLPDPKEIGNSGSFFKNPVVAEKKAGELLLQFPSMPNYPAPKGVKLAAGWLIEQCGWKGKRVGQTGAHAKQALVLVNYGGAKGADVWSLAKDIQQSVMERFGVQLQPEVNVI